MNLDDRELEQHIARVKIPSDPRKAGGEINFKAKRRWEILRHTESYRRDWDAAFARMVEILKKVLIIGPEDYGFETDIEKLIKDPKKRTVDNIFKEHEKINKKIEKRRAELMKDPQAWEDFLKRKYEKDWPPEKLKIEFIYSEYTTEGRKLSEKYGLLVPYHYDDPLWDPYKDNMRHVFKDMEPVRMIVHKSSKYEKGPEHKIIANHAPNLWEGRWLRIEIDLLSASSQKATWDMIKSIINFYKQECYPSNIEKRGPALNIYLDTEKGRVSIYDLWDMNKREGKSPWQITQELYPDATQDKYYQPYEKNYDNQARAKWMKIQSAIQKADDEIKEAER